MKQARSASCMTPVLLRVSSVHVRRTLIDLLLSEMPKRLGEHFAGALLCALHDSDATLGTARPGNPGAVIDALAPARALSRHTSRAAWLLRDTGLARSLLGTP